MFRNLFRRGIPAFVLILVLAGAVPAAALPSSPDRWEGIWGWLVSFWYDGETGEGDRGPGADPDGLPEPDPDDSAGGGDRGAGLDPNG